MNVLEKIFEKVAYVAPDGDRDELMRAHRFLGQPLAGQGLQAGLVVNAAANLGGRQVCLALDQNV